MKKILVTLLTCILLLNLITIVPASAAVDNSKYIPKIVTENGKSNLVFDPEVAKIAKEMANDTYSMSKSKKASTTAKTLKNEDFTDIQQNFHEGKFIDNFLLADNFHVGVKTFEINGEKKHILAIAFRGSHDNGDWYVNFAGALPYDGFHIGFYTAADDAHKTLRNMKFESLNMTFNEYLNYAKTTDDYYILVTGHSLGGAIANIYAGEYLASKCGIRDAVMCYTFAAPTVCTANKAKQRNATNIFNIINTEDIVPKVGYVWGDSARFGKDLKVKETNSTEDAHDLEVTYEKVLIQVINNIGSLYKYTIPYYIKWKNEGTGDAQGSNEDGGKVENESNGSGSNNPSVNTTPAPEPTPAPAPKPSTPASISLSKSSINLDIPSKRTDTVEITLSGTLPSRYRLDFDCSSSVQISWGGWTNNSKKNSLTITATENTQNGSTATIFLRDDDGNTYATATIPVRVTTSWTSMTLKAPSSIGIDYVKNPTQKVTVEINGTMPNSSLQTICNNSISAEMKNWNGKTGDVYITANYKLKDIDGIVALQLVDEDNRVIDSTQIEVYNTSPVYSVSYDLNGGYYPSQYKSGYIDEKGGTQYKGFDFLIDLDSPQKEGYNFLGWSKSSKATTPEFNRGDYYTEGKDTVLYAVWKKKNTKFNLEFDRYELVSDDSYRAVYTINGEADLIYDMEYDCDDNIKCGFSYDDESMRITFTKRGEIRNNAVKFWVVDEYEDVLFEDVIKVFEDEDTSDEEADVINYSIQSNSYKTLSASTLYTKCKEVTGETLEYVKFTAPSKGKLYYKYNKSGEYVVTSSDRFYYKSADGDYINYVSYVPEESYSGTATIKYTAVSESGEGFSGVIKVKVSNINDNRENHNFKNFGYNKTYKNNMFRDVDENAWYGANVTGVIKDAYSYGLMQGRTSGTFDPNGNMTVAEAITIAARIGDIYFDDNTDFGAGDENWYDDYVAYAIEYKIIRKNDFANYDAKITRAEMAYIFANILPEEAMEEINDIDEILDVSEDDEYFDEILYLYRVGILLGDDTGAFNPKQNITRAEVSAIITRIVDVDARLEN